MRSNDTKTGLLTIITIGLLGVACSAAPGEPGDTGGPGDIEDIDVAAGETPATQGADPATIVRGSVLDARNGSIVAGASVCVPSLYECTVTAEDGSIKLDAAAPDGELSAYVFADGYYASRSELHVSDGVAWLQASLLPVGALEQDTNATIAALLFRIVDLVGTSPLPAEGVEVHVDGYSVAYTNDEGRFDATYAATGADGLALLQHVAFGPLDVDVEESFGAGCKALADGGMVSNTTLAVEAGTITTVDIVCD